MDRGAKIAVALGVLVTGTALAMLFRPEPTGGNPLSAEGFDRLVLRGRIEPQFSAAPAPVAPAVAPESLRPAAPPPAQGTFAAPGLGPPDSGSPPPMMPRSSPPSAEGLTPWGAAVGLGATRPSPAPGKPRGHKIVDGDTLVNLAERYLGTAAAAAEIFTANRAVLSSPDLLPIGLELKIPLRRPSPAEQSPAEQAGTDPTRRLMPIPRPVPPGKGL